MKNILILLILVSGILYSQTFKVNGKLIDSTDGKALSFANIRIGGTHYGTSANFDGEFLLKLKKGKHQLVFSYIGYKSDSIDINLIQNMEFEFSLVPEAVRLPEVIVNEEDPAYGIIREAINRKKINRAGLINFEYDAYSKKIVKSVGKIALIEETFAKGYNKLNEWEKEFIKSVHKTDNMKKENSNMDFNITSSYFVDFSADTLSLFENVVYLPISDDAFDYYDYKLLKITESDDKELYTIKVIPKSKIQPLIKGEIVIDSKDYALNSINLTTNEGVRFPYVNNIFIEFKQELNKNYGYWLPQYVEYNSSVEVNFQGLIIIGKMDFNQLSNITNYVINGPIPDSVKNAVKSKHGGFVADTTDSAYKPMMLTRAEVDSLREIPLTQTEVVSYSTIDSSLTMRKVIKIEGALSGLIPDEEETEVDTTTGNGIVSRIENFATNNLEFRNNRVTGLLFGLRYDGDLIEEKLSLNTSAGYSFDREEVEGRLFLNFKPTNFWIDEIDFGFYKQSMMWQNLTPYPDLANSIGVTLGFEDQFNYYLAEGFQLGLTKEVFEGTWATLGFISEKQSSLKENKYQSIFSSDRSVRVNPAIVEGTDNRLSYSMRIGSNPLELNPIPHDGLIFRSDFSIPGLNSDFDYQRLRIIGNIFADTFYDELFVSPYLQLMFDASIIRGDYGPQHIFTPTSALSFYSPMGSFKGVEPYPFVGTEMIALHLEHNWRTVPFQFLGLEFLTDLHLDVITGVSGLKMWNDSNYLTEYNMDEEYWEAYLSISRIIAFLRVDFSYNSLDQFHVRIGTGILF